MKTTLGKTIFHAVLLLFTASAVGIGAVRASASDSGYTVIKKIPIPGQGSWDYLTVDENARRLYVSHGTQVEVLDVDTGAIVGKIGHNHWKRKGVTINIRKVQCELTICTIKFWF